MSTLIRDARLRRGVGVRELARRCGVAAPTVLGWERAEASESIQFGTLERALAAMGERLTVAGRPEHARAERLERREHRLGLELHRTIAMKLIEHPEPVLASARERLSPMRESVQGGAKAWVDRWESLIESRDLGGLVDVMLGTTQADIDLRSVSPFTGLLSADERRDVITRATAA